MSTPMLDQYLSLKQRYPDALLLYRMGDFYECFFDDAKLVAKELDIVLTARNKNDPNPVPMAGVPHHAAASYIQTLIDRGFRVAIAEQLEDPALAKGLVKRDVVRVVTPGVVMDPAGLAQREPCWLVAVSQRGKRYGLAFLDLTTGAARCTSVPDAGQLAGEIARHEPREALLGPGVNLPALARALRGVAQSPSAPGTWEPGWAEREVLAVLGAPDLRAAGLSGDDAALCAIGAALAYGREMGGGPLKNVHEVQRYRTSGYLVLDDMTRRNLEITRTMLHGRRQGSLLALLDQSATSLGGRQLKEWLGFPLLDLESILSRQRGVGALVDDPELLAGLSAALEGVADMERICARITQETAHARDLAALVRSLAAAPVVAALTESCPGLTAFVPRDLCASVAADIAKWLVEEPPPALTEGGMIREGADAELDEIIELALNGMAKLDALAENERKSTGIGSLKLVHHKALGWQIEVSAANAHKVPRERFFLKQQLTNSGRYTTEALEALAMRLTSAQERRRKLEYEHFVALRARVAEGAARLQGLAKRFAELDALCALAKCAVRWRWVRPEVNEGRGIQLTGGRHPVVEASLRDERFVPNDLDLDPVHRRFVVLTGPNMSGKSTIMRQVALICLLAQIGSFVPAEAAALGICDRIFTRVGAADDLSRGQSTFMVEMAETATILAEATERSLVLLDEIGRGTSTYDGLSIAWAVSEDLATRVGCRAIFATHYHELCALAEELPGVINQSVAVSESGESIAFLRRLKEGGASRSYGIQCARIAGLPGPVISRARSLLSSFEKRPSQSHSGQVSLFAPAPAPAAVDPLREALRALDPDVMSPREAQNALYALRSLMDAP